MAEIFGYPIMGGGGNGSGGTLTVTGVAGSTVTVSNADKSYTRTLDSTGKAMFNGLASGTWTVTMTNGSQTATRTVEITADYSVSIAYFASTINVTYPAGSMCTATDGVTTLTAPNTTGTWECIVPNAGTWTVSSVKDSMSASQTVEITTEEQVVTVKLLYSLYLFDYGPCTDVTGGWKNKMSTQIDTITATTNADGSVTIDSTGAGGYPYKFISNSFDKTKLSEYTKCCLLVGNVYNPGHGWGGASFEIAAGNTSYPLNGSDPDSSIASATLSVDSADKKYEIDIASIGAGFPMVVVTGRKATIKQIWLE